MSIRILEVGKPVMTVKYIEHEKEVEIGPSAILMNTSYEARKDIMIGTIPLKPFRSTIVGNIVIPEIDSAVMIEDYESLASDPDIFKKVETEWTHMYELNREERFKGVPHYLAPGDGDVTDKMNISLHGVLGKQDIGLHRTHARGDIDEYHCQVLGFALMQKFHENDMASKYEDDYMAPGQIHDTIFDDKGVYPWHQYQSLTDSVFVGIQILR